MALEPIDVAVIGAGPAGSTAARLLASWGHTVALVGRAASRRQLAESLPPSCTKLFERLGVRSAIDAAGFVHATGNTVQWGGRERRVEYFDGGTYGYQVPRGEFDALLLVSGDEHARRRALRRDGARCRTRRRHMERLDRRAGWRRPRRDSLAMAPRL